MELRKEKTNVRNVQSMQFQDKRSEGVKEEQSKNEKNSSFTKRIKSGAAVLMIAAIVSIVVYGMVSTSRSVDTGIEAKEAIETHMSVTLAAGTRLMEKDDNYIGGDITITHNRKEAETLIWVWDYAAEDGDYVQILVNGTSLGEPFMITNKPVSFTVPAVGEIQVLGTRDGGGGITYGVYYELNQTTYFNGMDEGGDNLYTLIYE